MPTPNDGEIIASIITATVMAMGGVLVLLLKVFLPYISKRPTPGDPPVAASPPQPDPLTDTGRHLAVAAEETPLEQFARLNAEIKDLTAQRDAAPATQRQVASVEGAIVGLKTSTDSLHKKLAEHIANKGLHVPPEAA